MGSVFRGCQVACIGFTFTKDSPLSQIGQLGSRLSSQTNLLPSAGVMVNTECNADGRSTTPTSDIEKCPKCPSLTVSADMSNQINSYKPLYFYR